MLKNTLSNSIYDNVFDIGNSICDFVSITDAINNIAKSGLDKDVMKDRVYITRLPNPFIKKMIVQESITNQKYDGAYFTYGGILATLLYLCHEKQIEITEAVKLIDIDDMKHWGREAQTSWYAMYLKLIKSKE